MQRFLAALLLALPLLANAASSGNAGESPYLALEPLVVNVQDGAHLRFMQVKVQVMSSNATVLEALKLHMPALRDALIMLLAHQNAEGLSSLEGREALRAQALAAAQEVLTRFTGSEADKAATIEAIYFTDFIIQ